LLWGAPLAGEWLLTLLLLPRPKLSLLAGGRGTLCDAGFDGVLALAT
jgi:hypothetical protein